MRDIWTYLGIFALLAGCAAPPRDMASTVEVPVPVACLPADTPDPPGVRSDAELKGLGDGDFVLAIAEEREKLKAWVARVAPHVEACRAQQQEEGAARR